MNFTVRNRHLAGIVVCALTAVTSGAAAQQDNTAFLTATDADDGLSIQAQSRGIYSDNILRLSAIEQQLAIDQGLNLTPEDYVLDVGGDLTLRKRIGRNVLSLDAGAGYRFHDNNTILDNERFNGTALFAWQLGSRCTGSVGGTWARALAQFETAIDVSTDNTLTTLSGGGQATCNLLRSVQVTGSAVFSTADNSNALREINDFDNEAYTASLRYAFGRGSYIGAFYQYTDTVFTSPLTGFGGDAGFTTTTIGGELGFTFGRGLTVLGSFGAVDVREQGGFVGGGQNLDGVSGRLTVNIPIGANQRLEFEAFQDVRALESVAATVSQVRGGNFLWSAKWTPRFSTQFNLIYEDRTLTQDENVALFIADDETVQFSLALDYRLGRFINLNLRGNIADRNAAVDEFDFVENSVILGVRFNFN